jgi:hypothetical protein
LDVSIAIPGRRIWMALGSADQAHQEAVAEIKKAAREDKILGAEGAVIFLEKVSGTLEHVDRSSGAIGTAVNRAIETLAQVVAQAPASDNLRDKWLERLWRAIEDDDIPYIELLPDHWGQLCVTPERASRWADRFIEGVRLVWSPSCHVEATSRAPLPA